MQVEFLDKRVVKEFAKLPNDMQANYLHILELMERQSSHAVGLPHVKSLQKPLWEIRLKGKDGIARALYIAEEKDRLVILHVFIKKTQKTPKQAIELALKRWREAK